MRTAPHSAYVAICVKMDKNAKEKLLSEAVFCATLRNDLFSKNNLVKILKKSAMVDCER